MNVTELIEMLKKEDPRAVVSCNGYSPISGELREVTVVKRGDVSIELVWD